MNGIISFLSNLPNLLLVILGFGAVVFVHELGHFLAARWARIQVLAFAIGIGPAIASYRRGIGFRWGSSEAEAKRRGGAAADQTEYRINVLPFGGYVKMLGQVDGDPTAVSSLPGSYQNCPPWKRLVVISAGVVANILLAVPLFILVYSLGKIEPPPIVGPIVPGSPAARAKMVALDNSGAVAPGLREGDRILSLNGETPRHFSDVSFASAMASRGEVMTLVVSRVEEGGPRTLQAEIVPLADKLTGLLSMGFDAPLSGELFAVDDEAALKEWRDMVGEVGLTGVAPGMKLVSVNGHPAASAGDLEAAARHSEGRDIGAVFAGPTGDPQVSVTIHPSARRQSDLVPLGKGEFSPVDHLLGLTPVMSVHKTSDVSAKQGLKAGDLFARIGDTEYPNFVQGITAIRAHAGGTVDLVVLRETAPGTITEVALPGIKVTGEGTIGFTAGDTSDRDLIVAMPPRSLKSLAGFRPDDGVYTPAAGALITAPGTRIVSVNGAPVKDFTALRAALVSATADAYSRWGGDGLKDPGHASVDVRVGLRRPSGGRPAEGGAEEVVTWTLGYHDVCELHRLGWRLPFEPGAIFRPELRPVPCAGPGDAIGMGLRDTRRIVMSTYLTFARLAEGTVRVKHLKGPVGIAHLGTIVASRGLVELLFFLAMISVNLAVINFLPIPIMDGGQFLFIVYEQFRGRPPSMAFQNIATQAAFLLIVSVFLLVTFNDIRALLGI